MASFEGAFDIERAFTALYPEQVVAVTDNGVELSANGSLTWTQIVLLAAPFVENQTPKYVLITANTGTRGTCQECRAPLSGAIFAMEASVWRIETYNPRLSQRGEWEKLPSGQLVQIGHDKYGFLFLGTHSGLGAQITSLVLYSNISGQLVPILSLSDLATQYESDCMMGPCPIQGYDSTFSFSQGSDPFYFDLHIKTIGTKWGNDGNPYDVNEEHSYVFNGEEYSQP